METSQTSRRIDRGTYSPPYERRVLFTQEKTMADSIQDLADRFIKLVIPNLPWWKRFLLKRLLKGLFLILLLVAPVSSSELTAAGDGYTLHLQSQPLGRAAYEDLTWYPGRIVPTDTIGVVSQVELDRLLRFGMSYGYACEVLKGYAAPFNWRYAQELNLVFQDGSRIGVASILAGVELSSISASYVSVYPLERPLRFTDLLCAESSLDSVSCPVWCGFPRQPSWNSLDVIAIELPRLIGGILYEDTQKGSLHPEN